MFTEEFNVSKVYRLSTRSLMHTHSSMWAYCTCAESDEYPDIFTPDAKEKVKDILDYDYVSPYEEVSRSLVRFVDVYYNDSIEEIEVTSDIDLASLNVQNEMLHAVSTLDIVDDIKEKFVEWHDQDRAVQAKICSVIIDNNGTTTGLVTTARKHDPQWNETAFGQLINELGKADQRDVYFKHRKGDTGVAIRIWQEYNARRIDIDGTPKKINSLSWRRTAVSIAEKRNYYIDVVKDRWQMISEDDATWIRSLIDHEDQEIDFEFEFNGDKTLRDVLVYKREVKEFKVNRP